MITWRETAQGPHCTFKTKPDFVLTGRSHRAYGEEFTLPDSEYADDTAVLYTSRERLEAGVPQLIKHFARFGLEVHTGNTRTKKDSKSEVLFCPKPRQLYGDPDTFDNANLAPIDLGRGMAIPVVFQFLGINTVA